ncbi:hypothetical protein [Pseudocitrobacter sp. 73]|uniref:hypothetical protein n=1 Tax=Pseudocitrobacter sp. 73 TaxID=2605731 RepID=UPI0011EFA313|nr:hypothetical protein [Pseudocitrobacter sp. 73]KAA1047535.1 hypothetical protein F0Q32_18395 [Pseudocitrobacter sp. 73]
MIESIEKDKIAKNFCFILKTKMLENILLENEVNIYINLNYWNQKSTGSIFEAHFWPPNENVAYQRCYIRAGALPEEDVVHARSLLQDAVLPKFIVWIKKILSPEGDVQYYENLYFEARYQNNILKLIQKPSAS